ncbi:transcription elongation factor SPT5 [Enteropsectra breve]|nr:transcription elongation factor SPT5 [Enteropsectra breve]
MPRKAARAYLKIEAESGSSEFDSEEISEDIDNINTERVKSRNYSDFAREIEEKYKDADYESETESQVAGETETLNQSAFLPGPRSPLLFLVRCKFGKEKDICLRIFENAKKHDICSVIQKEGLKGYLYIEAYKKQAVEDCLTSIRGVSRNRLNVVPFREMIEAISYKKNFIINEYARIKNGKYKGDLVKILEVFEDMVKIKAIPRINNEKKYFDAGEHRGEVVSKDDGFYYNRDFYKDGFLIKVVLKSNLDFDVEPTFSELEDLRIMGFLEVGDNVRVKKGDLVNLVGKVNSIQGNSAMVVADGKSYEITTDILEKHFQPGEEVSYKDSNGIILGIEKGMAVVGVNDCTNELKVPLSDLRKPVIERQDIVVPERMFVRTRRDPRINKAVLIKEGEYKGLKAIIKDVCRDEFRVQLDSNLKIINLRRDSLLLADEFGMEYRSREDPNLGYQDAYRTPGYKTPGYKTPGYKTPGYKTPGYTTPGYKTPGYKTPGYTTPGYKTPGYKTPGYKTPGYKTPGDKTPGGYFDGYDQMPVYNDDAGTGWLNEKNDKSVYEGALVAVNNREIVLSDYKDGKYYDKKGDAYAKEDINFVVPEKYDNIVVMSGDNSGKEGTLVRINDESGVIKMLNGDSFNVSLKNISKKEMR